MNSVGQMDEMRDYKNVYPGTPAEPVLHTPGPWVWWTSNSWRRLRHSDRGVSTNVLYPTVHKDGQADIDVSEADARLIAAAPDMLAVCKAVSAHYGFIEAPLAEMARRAIAKAEGRDV